MSAEWQHGLFGCFDNIGLSVIAFLFPCYQFGKNARIVGEDCFQCGLFYAIPFVNIFATLKVRGRIRDIKGIQGSILSDALAIGCCPFCALIQEAQEMDTGPGSRVMSIMKLNAGRRNPSMDGMGAEPEMQSMDRTEMGAGPVNQVPGGTEVDASPGNQSTDKKATDQNSGSHSADKVKAMDKSSGNQSADKVKAMDKSSGNQSADKVKAMDKSSGNQSADKVKAMDAGPGNQSIERQ